MSANPTRFDGRVQQADLGSHLQEGNRVLESIAQQEALRALLAFSELHEQIRNRRIASGGAFDRDWFETERFILDEVLQLICDRAQAITHADGILIALAEGPDVVCRAACGTLEVPRGAPLNPESKFLQVGLQSGRIARSDDCKIDARTQMDFAREIGARSTVLVPLRGRREQLGVLQAFSTRPRAFTDDDVHCFDLFAELVLSALKPEDQDRRVGWLSDVADEVLHPKSAAEVDDPVSDTLSAQQMGMASDDASDSADGDDDLTDGVPQSLAATYALSLPEDSRPGLGVVIALVLVAALFSAGTWWEMRGPRAQNHGKSQMATKASAKTATSGPPTTPQVAATGALPSIPPATPTDNSVSYDLVIGSETASETPGADASNTTAVAKITGVRHWSSIKGSTVVIDMEDHVPYEVHRLSSPERVYFDLHGTAPTAELGGKSMDVGDPSLSRVRIGQPVAGVTRVVLDTKDGANFSVSMESSPYRLVVELRDDEKTAASNRLVPAITIPDKIADTTSAPAKASPVPSKVSPAAPLQSTLQSTLQTKTSDQPLPVKTGRFRIVLDAGHGGWDLGTVGRHGLLEKDLVLDVTERLGKLLRTRLGSEVLFTRTDDTYLPLDQRADIANQAQADLFVSVHANYSTSASARGIETYYTNLFSAPGSKEAEQHEDGSFTKLMPVSLSVENLHEKIEESRRLAASVQRSLYATLASNSPDIRNRGIKDAAFAVLTGTTMPSILTEISFVSSPADEHNLQDPAYRQQIAEALYQGIARYQQTSPRAKVAQLQTAAATR